MSYERFINYNNLELTNFTWPFTTILRCIIQKLEQFIHGFVKFDKEIILPINIIFPKWKDRLIGHNLNH